MTLLFEIMIFLDAILEDEETFWVSIEPVDSAINVSVHQSKITIVDSTSKFTAGSKNTLYIVIMMAHIEGAYTKYINFVQLLISHSNRLSMNLLSRVNHW